MTNIAAIDIGGTKIGAGLICTRTGNITRIPDLPTPAREGSGAVCAAAAQQLSKILENGRAEAIGISTAGIVDTDSGTITSATDLIKNWAGTNLKNYFQNEYALPTFALNDVHAHALGEAKWGVGKNYRSILSVAVGTGMGGAFVQDGRLLQGAHFASGHVGHVVHPLARGLECSCGGFSHIETVASGSGQVRFYNNKRPPEISEVFSGKEISTRAAQGEKYAQKILEETAYALGQVLGGLCNCFDPHAVILSGSVTKSGSKWLTQVKAGYSKTALPPLRSIPLLKGELGSTAPLLGAASWADSKLEETNEQGN
ncbi:MAG: ROK family protein [Winkia neuii]|uniref:ROK family protein n=1 Tax=Winkia neuii TaxID=33007 RepID=A0A2I1IQ63_9ACTO|nr:ROK family protein [Winkia neuii]OFJ72272.1 hypothetical protein HMPREF2851_04925 [Actinomyces sp. HMSC064C12]OFK01987.1 hypothetical protein HMPREF2835_08160 [Actinomyces sp. HMSC072A03]OFT54517.1 hypothetical protein HMPREF3152_08555 [Actinomyces sp. HMSC06A08]KWZ74354.1 ROK family protein [Winkia neuii]MDK8098771.1 ROK family protein [Winkia neuii]